MARGKGPEQRSGLESGDAKGRGKREEELGRDSF